MSISEEIKVLNMQISELATESNKIKTQITKLQSKVVKLKTQQAKEMPSVTDHAILRMAERKYGVNVEQIKNEILCDAVKDAIKAGAKRIKHDGMEYVLNNGLVVTVLN